MPLTQMRRTILAKIETTENTDSSPTGSANAIAVSNFEVMPQESEFVERNLVRAYMGSSESIAASIHQKVTFDVEVAGAGAAGTVPAYDCLLRACGFTPTVDAGVSVTYDLVSDGFESVTIYAYVDKILHKLTGARGKVTFDFTAKQLGMMKFEFTGRWRAATATTLPTSDYGDFVTPVAFNYVNTPTMSVHGYNAAVNAISFDTGNNVVYRNMPGRESVDLTDRKMVGNMTIEAPEIGDKDFFTIAKNTTPGAISLIHGTTAGNIVEVSAPSVTVSEVAYQEQDGVVMLSMKNTYLPVDGDDEFQLIIR